MDTGLCQFSAYLWDGAERGNDGDDDCRDELEEQDEPVKAQDLPIAQLRVICGQSPTIRTCSNHTEPAAHSIEGAVMRRNGSYN